MRPFIKSISVVLCFLATGALTYGQTTISDKPPTPKTFSLNPDNIGALQNSINLLTGQVAFPMNVVSLPGKNNLNISVSFQYNSSGIENSVTTINKYSSTGILGLGWSMELSRIVVNNNQTATRHDDEYYLIENGSSNKLVCTSHSSTLSKYQTKNHNFWTIEFYAQEEKWIIKREDGTKYVYGDKNSARGTVQWMVKWGNWIGNSTQPANQQQIGFAWNLSEVENMWGDKMIFEYENAEEYVALDASNITSEKQHTKASYLKRIVDPAGQSVELFYEEKQPAEFSDPHVEKVEPDAYQEKFESKYLDSIVVKTIDERVLYTVDLQYALSGAGGLVKRYLKQVQKRFPNNETQPATQFEYFETGESRGYLKQVINSLGAHVDYYYETVYIPNSDRKKAIIAPAGYGQPRLFIENNYTVVTWRKLKSDGTEDGAPQPVKIFAYYWDGRWFEEELWQTIGIKLTDYDNASMAMSENNFAYRVFNGSSNNIFSARKKTGFTGTGHWVKQLWAHGTSGDPNVTGTAYAGRDFVAYVSRFLNEIRTAVWKGEQWVEHRVPIPESSAELFCAAGPNYIFVHNDFGGNQDILHLLYLDEEKKWNTKTLPAALGLDTDGEITSDSYWHSAPSFVVGLPQYNPEYIYSWDENYDNFSRLDILGLWYDNSLVSIINNSQFSFEEPSFIESSPDGISARFDGVNWIKKGPYGSQWYQDATFGEDFLIRVQDTRARPREIYLSTFDANTRAWNGDVQYINDEYVNGGTVIQAGINSFVIKDGVLYSRSVSGEWGVTDKVYLQGVPFSTVEYLRGREIFPLTPNYVAYGYSNTQDGVTDGVYVALMRNDSIRGYEKFPGVTLQQNINNRAVTNASLNTLALLNGNSSLTLYRVLDGSLSGNLTTHVARSLTRSDGYQIFETTYEYENGKAAPGGLIAYFNSVMSVPGSSNHSSTPFGKVQHYFYNGMPEDSLSVLPPNGNPGKELLTLGLPYQDDVYDAAGALVSSSRNFYKVFSRASWNSAPEVNDSVFYIRSIRSEQTLDGLTNFVETTYSDQTGLPVQTKQFNSRASGLSNGEEIVSVTKYWWEAYDADRSENILSPVIQQTEQRDGQSVGSSVIKWKLDTAVNKYFPHETYQWLLTGSVNFTAWGEGATPSADWLLLTKASRIDPSDGTVLEVQNQNGTSEATLYDTTHTRVLARATYAAYDQIAFTSFEGSSKGNWSYSENMFLETDRVTGSRCYQSQQPAPTDPDFTYIYRTVPQGTYEVSYWMKVESPVLEMDNGTVLQSDAIDEQNGWTLIKALVRIASGTGTVKLRVPVNGLVDEARLNPKGSVMTTSVYNKEGNITDKTDRNLVQTHYSYDGQYRISTVRDHKNRIVESYSYHFRNQ